MSDETESELAGRLQAAERALADAIENLAALTARVEVLEREVLPREPSEGE